MVEIGATGDLGPAAHNLSTHDPTTELMTYAARVRYARVRLAGAQKGTAAVPAYLRYVNRRLGGLLACLSFGLGLTPSQVSALSALSSGAGLVVLATAPSTTAIGVVVALAMALGYALDSADGQLARVRGGGSRAGEWLDHVLDMAKVTALHSCVLIAFYRYFDLSVDVFLLVPLIFLAAQALNFFGNMLRDQLRANAGLSQQPTSVHTSLLASLVLLPFDHGTVCWMFLLLGWHDGFLSFYTALTVVSAAFAMRALIRSYRNLDAIDAAHR